MAKRRPELCIIYVAESMFEAGDSCVRTGYLGGGKRWRYLAGPWQLLRREQ
jgi:hypothetical protein